MSASDQAGFAQLDDYVMISDDESDDLELKAHHEQHSSAATSHIAQDQPEYMRNPALFMEEINSSTVKEGVNLRPRRTVELKDGDFLRIESLHRNCISGEVVLLGPRFRRTKLFPMMEKRLNEVCWLVDVNLNEGKSSHIQKTDRVPASQVLRIRGLRLSNRIFPQCSFRDDGYFKLTDKIPGGKEYKEKAYNSFHLVCRTKYIRYFRNSEMWRLGKVCENAIERLSEQEADECYRVEDAALKRQWRETTVQGTAEFHNTMDEDRIIRLLEDELGVIHLEESDGLGAEAMPFGDVEALNRDQASMTEHKGLDVDADPNKFSGQQHSGKRRSLELESVESPVIVHDLTGDDDSPAATTKVDCDKEMQALSYTFGDAYCGGGGSSRGAAMAGLDIRWGVDKEVTCALTYAQNFPDAAVHASVDQFCQLRYDDHVVDVLHLSPPCQPYSGAHTWEGKDDEINTAALFGVGPMLRKARCRVAMLEETSGLLAGRHAQYFNALINLFLVNNFSIRWTIKNFSDYGLPQPRKRLIIFASCPGETLPEFPAPTHSDDPDSDLKPYVTIHDAIKHIQPGDHLHNLDTVRARDEEPYSAHTQLQRAVMCSGTSSYHSSGKRDFTVAELAALQTFPPEHRFGDHSNTVIRRQIGNAVPPAVWKTFCEKVIEALKNADGVKDA